MNVVIDLNLNLLEKIETNIRPENPLNNIIEMLTIRHKYPKIVSTPEVCSGAPRIKGTRIRVSDIVRMHKIGFSIKEIADWYSIDVEDVREALEYYKEHRDEIDKLIEEEDKIAEEIAKEYDLKY